MRILLTNQALSERSGTEVYLRDIALALLARGHEPIAYSRRLGEVARELRRATVPVLDDLASLERPPDLIHAQHHLETMTALARFPETPAVFVCHGWLPAEEAPPRHPRILRHLAVDELVRRRLVEECGLDASRIEVHLNFVDLERFRPRPPLPERPRRALVFSNHVSDDNHLPILRVACGRLGITLDAIGRAVGTASARPEEVLGRYDVVFAKGRAALEAAAVGAAVVLCDVVGLGPLVTSSDFERIRGLNCGVRLLREPVTVDRIVERLESYDADDAAEVTRRMRREASMEASVDRLVASYQTVLGDARSRVGSQGSLAPRGSDMQAIARYLRHGPLTGGDLHQVEREQLLSRVAQERERVAVLRQTLEVVRTDNARLEAEAIELHRAAAREHAEKVGMASTLEAERSRFESERALARHLESLEASRIELDARRERIEQELAAARRTLESASDQAERERRDLEAAREALETAREALATAHADAESARTEAEAARDAADQARAIADAARTAAESAHGEQVAELTAALDASRSRLEQQERVLESRDMELRWIVGSATWRLRETVLALPGLRALYRWLRRA